VSQNQKGKTNLDFTEAGDSEWHQLGHMQVCTSLQTDNHASTPPLRFYISCCPNNSVKVLKAHTHPFNGPFSGTTQVSQYQKGKTNLDFTGVAVASAGPYANLHIAPDKQPCQHPTTQFFTDRMPFLPPNQQRQSTEGSSSNMHVCVYEAHCLKLPATKCVSVKGILSFAYLENFHCDY